MGSGEIGCGWGVVGESEWDGDEGEDVAGSVSALSVNFLRF
jgi:hypothetical protein